MNRSKLLIALAVATANCMQVAIAAETQPPNFIIFLTDDQGWGDLGCYGHPVLKTPNIDQFAAQGMRFTQCYAGSAFCSPSRSAILTGRTPYRNGVFTWIPQNNHVHLRSSEITIASLLQARGYTTCHVGKWHLNGHFNSPRQPQPDDHGYDYWFATQNNAAPSHKNPVNFVRNGQAAGQLNGFSSILVAQEAIDWLRMHRDKAKPFFMTVWTHEPHLPIESDPKFMALYNGDDDLKQHHGNISQLDHAFGMLMDTMDEMQLTENTFVVFTSDNGPEGRLDENNYPIGRNKRTRGSTGGLRGRKRDVYEGGIRVPGIVRWPGQVKPGTESNVPIIGSDIFTTICEIVDVPVPADRPIDGSSMLPAFNGQPIQRQIPLYWRCRIAQGPKTAMRIGDWKILADEALTEFELYNISKDPQEKQNLAGEHRDKLHQMQAALRKLNAEIEAEGPDWWKDYGRRNQQKAKRVQQTRPNIVWIVAEDASPHLSCYGETTIRTPNLDKMARGGIRFTNAFVTCPVCSPSRSAMVTGMYQTTLGAHNHRSQADTGKAGGNSDYYDSYQLPVKTIPRLFKDAGYYTCNSATGTPRSKFGKTDYNFIWDRTDYDAADWARRRPGQPFFAQVQLRGGKNRRAKQHGTDPAKVKLPPYYPDHPVLRDDWADYLNSWVQTDVEVGNILTRLKDEGLSDSTVVFFWTDHGVSHLRGKQFLYEEGIHVPLIARFPDGKLAGQVRTDLVTHIDIAATSLALAGIDIPDHVQGVDLLAENYRPRDMVFAARDRCDETVEIMRSVRTPRYKYIRNFLPHLPHAQPNQYKDGKQIVQTLRQLHADGQLTELQSRPFASPRPREELYDLELDPHETMNLAEVSEHAQTVESLRSALYAWMVSSRDVGLIPEPILEDLGRKYGSKYEVLRHEDNTKLVRQLLSVIEAGERGDMGALRSALTASNPAVRYWAASVTGLHGRRADADLLVHLTNDESAGVRVAAALAHCRLGRAQTQSALLAREMNNDNLVVGMYAIRGLELIGPQALPHLREIQRARNGQYEFTRRIARRLTVALEFQDREISSSLRIH